MPEDLTSRKNVIRTIERLFAMTGDRTMPALDMPQREAQNRATDTLHALRIKDLET